MIYIITVMESIKAEGGVVGVRYRPRVIALSAIFFGTGIFITYLFPSCVVIVLTSLVIIIVGCIALRC